MAIIYSRPRIKLPKVLVFDKRGNRPKSKKKIILISMLLSILISIRAITPIFNELCVNRAKQTAILVIAEEVYNSISGYNYSDFIIIHKDNIGNVLMLESNMININKVISDVSNRIQSRVNNIKDEDISINLGSFTGISILSGRGYPIPIRISTIGNVQTKVKSEFVNKGINQTLHRLYLNINCEISILTPFNTIKENISNELIIGENIIVGNIPESYYNLEGIANEDAVQLVK